MTFADNTVKIGDFSEAKINLADKTKELNSK